MTQTDGKQPKLDINKKKENERARPEKALEERLEETFPASDAVTEPAPTRSDDSHK